MTRRRQQGKQHAKRAQKAAHERLESLSGTYIPDRTDKRTKQWDTAYDDANTLRIQFNTWRDGKTLVDFVIVIQLLGANGWDDIERFDCCHGHCHLHNGGTGNREPIYQLDSADDVQIAFVRASDEAQHRARIIRNTGKGVNR